MSSSDNLPAELAESTLYQQAQIQYIRLYDEYPTDEEIRAFIQSDEFDSDVVGKSQASSGSRSESTVCRSLFDSQSPSESSGVQIIERDAGDVSDEFERVLSRRVIRELRQRVERNRLSFEQSDIADPVMTFRFPQTDRQSRPSRLVLSDGVLSGQLRLPAVSPDEESRVEYAVSRSLSVRYRLRFRSNSRGDGVVPRVEVEGVLEPRGKKFGRELLELFDALRGLSVSSLGELSDETVDASENIDAVDVETNDYIEIEEDGETQVSGVVQTVDVVGDQVVLDFVAGPSVRVHQDDVEADDVRIFIDDDIDGEDYRVAMSADSVYTLVKDEVPVKDWPEDSDLSRENVYTEIADQFDRAQLESLPENVAEHITEISDFVSRSAFYSLDHHIELNANSDPSVVHHELSHAIIHSYGFDVKRQAKAVSSLFSEGVMDDIELGDSFYDVLDTMQIKKNPQLRFNPDAGEAGKMKRMLPDEPLEPEMFYLSSLPSDDAPPEIERLVDEVNKAWERIFKGHAGYDIVHEYSGCNAHETFAKFHETMQSDSMTLDDAVRIFRYHEELLDAYLDVFEPADSQKRILNMAWSPDAELFDEEPFSEVNL